MMQTDVRSPMGNAGIAERLGRIADLLEVQDANPHRVRAYRRAAGIVRSMGRPVHELLEREGIDALIRLPGIGISLARTIEDLAFTGHVTILDRLEGAVSWENVLASVVGIGHELARRIYDELGIESLAELEAAAHDGRLERIPGIGRRRVRGVQESLAGRFRHRPRLAEPRRDPSMDPPMEELLDVDEEYRRKASGRSLVHIAPRRFNPTGAAWLPILHTGRGERHYTALYSNTARAHELGMTHDWVVIYRDDHAGDGQWTVVTSRFGGLKGQRVVRGREEECKEVYGRAGAAAVDGEAD